jgi:hypothetical protein
MKKLKEVNESTLPSQEPYSNSPLHQTPNSKFPNSVTKNIIPSIDDLHRALKKRV